MRESGKGQDFARWIVLRQGGGDASHARQCESGKFAWAESPDTFRPKRPPAAADLATSDGHLRHSNRVIPRRALAARPSRRCARMKRDWLLSSKLLRRRYSSLPDSR